MSLNTGETAHTSQEFLTSNTIGEDSSHQSMVFANSDSESESESQPCLHQPVSDYAQPSSNDSVCSVSTYGWDPSCVLDSCNSNTRKYQEDMDHNSPVIWLNHDTSSQETPSSKRRNSRSDRFSVKYSVIESKPLISECDYEIDPEHHHPALPIVSNHFTRKFPYERSTSLGNISDTKGTIFYRNKQEHITSNMTASPSPTQIDNFNTNAASTSGSLSIQCTPVLDIESVLGFDVKAHPTFRPQLLAEAEQLDDKPQPLLDFSKLPTSQLDFCFTASSQQLTQPYHTDSQGQLCSHHPYQSGSSFAQNRQDNSSLGQELPTKTHQTLSSYSPAHGDARGICFIQQSSSLPSKDAITSATVSVKGVALDVKSVLGNGSPTPVRTFTHCPNTLLSKDKPLQVFVPRGKGATRPKEAHLAEIIIAPDRVKHHQSSLDTSCHHHPQLDNKPSTRTPSLHNDVAKDYLSGDDSNHQTQNTISDISHMNPIEDCNHEASVITLASTSPLIMQKRKSFSAFGSPKNNQQVCFCGESLSVHYPNPTCNTRQTDSSEPYRAGNPQNNVRLFCSQGSVISNPNSGNVTSPVSHKQNALKSQSENFRHIESDLASQSSSVDSSWKHSSDPSPANSPDSVSSCANERQVTNVNTLSHKLENLHSHDSHAVRWHSTTSPLTTDHKHTDYHTGQLGHINPCNQQGRMSNIMDNENGITNSLIKLNGYVTGPMQVAPGLYFETNMLEPQENIFGSKRDSMRNSMPSSIDSGHPGNRQGSLQRSNTSELGLLKVNSVTQQITGLSDRDIPDYSYLCIVATVLNPVIGLAAFLCNHYARKKFRLHKRAEANNLYFATITISTVAIFLTLVGAALLIMHSVVVQSEKRWPTAAPRAENCENKLFSYDDSLKTFFNIDLNLYCEVMKNEKIMQALKGFWLQDSQNKKACIKMSPGCDGYNNTQVEMSDDINATSSSTNIPNPYQDIIDVTSQNTKGPLESAASVRMKNLTAANVIQESVVPSPIQEPHSSHNTVVSSNDGPVVPPELEEEYRQFLEGNKRTKVSDGNPFLHGTGSRHPSVQSSVPLENKPPTRAANGNVNTIMNITPKATVESVTDSDDIRKPSGNSTAQNDI